MSPAGVRLGDLAERFSLELRGDAEARITGVATLARAQAQQLSFLANPAYRGALADCAAGAVVLRDADASAWRGNALVARDPYVAYARIAAVFEVRAEYPPGVHPSAVIDPAAHVAAGAHVGALAFVGPRSIEEAGAVIGPGCVIGEDCIVGAGCELVARVTLVRRVRLGRRVLIHPGAVLGADGFGIANDGGTWIKVPQLGGVVIGDDCEIGANTTIDRGALDDTTLHEDVRLDNQIQIGHNVVIGAHTAVAGCVAVAGSTTIGRHCLIGGAAGIAGHLQIADRVMVTAMTFVSASITAPGEYSSAIPAQDSKTWRRNAARLRRLDGFVRSQLRGGSDSD